MLIEKKATACRDYKCALCGGIIKKGEVYARRIVQTDDNNIEQLPCHLNCYNDNTFAYWRGVYKRFYAHYCKKCCDYDELQYAVDEGLIKADDSRIFFCNERIKEMKYTLGFKVELPKYDYAELQESEKELLTEKIRRHNG